jgi:glutamyl-tRNA synthetase
MWSGGTNGSPLTCSRAIHVQLFDLLGFEKPVYCHTAAMLKQDGEGKRKISKRKDPEADVAYHLARGCPTAGVVEYVLTLLNSNFEDWRRQNPDKPLIEFPFSLKKMSVSGALFDMVKFEDVCRTVIARMDAAHRPCAD